MAELKTARTVAKNGISLVMGSVLSQAIKVVYAAVLVRYIGAEGFGQISTATALVALLILPMNMGLDTVVIRDVASQRELAGKYVSNVLILRFVLALGLLILVGVIATVSPYTAETKSIISIYALVYGLDTFSDVARSIIHAYQKMEYAAAIDFARDLLNVSVTLIGISLGWSLIALVWVSAMASLFRLVVSMVVVRGRFVKPDWQIDLHLVRTLLVRASPFFVLVCIGVAGERLSTVILSWLDTPERVGIYSAAAVLVTTMLVVPMMFNHSIFPVFADFHKKSEADLGRAYKLAYKALLLGGLFIGAWTLTLSSWILKLVYGPGFEKSVIVINILAIQLLTMVGYVNGSFLKATGRQRLLVMLRIGSVTLSILLLLVLIPGYHYVGAALAVAIPAAIDFVVYTLVCHHFAKQGLPWRLVLLATVSAAIMVGAGHLAQRQGVAPVWVMLLSPALYIGLLAVMRVIRPEEWNAIGRMVFSGRLRDAVPS